MKFRSIIRIVSLAVLISVFYLPAFAGTKKANTLVKEKPKVLVVWSSGDKAVAVKMVHLYVYNAKKNGWVDDMHMLIWGPSAKLLSEDAELQASVKKMKESGIILTACKACADSYGVSDKLRTLGVDVKYMGKELTDMLQSGWKVITF